MDKNPNQTEHWLNYYLNTNGLQEFLIAFSKIMEDAVVHFGKWIRSKEGAFEVDLMSISKKVKLNLMLNVVMIVIKCLHHFLRKLFVCFSSREDSLI